MRILITLFFCCLLLLTSCQRDRSPDASSYKKQMKHIDWSFEQERAAIERGLQFLLHTQNSSGSWGLPDETRPRQIFVGTIASYQAFESATTALCCLSLLEAQDLGLDVGDSLQRGIDYLMRLEPARRSTPDELYSMWSVAFSSLCLVRCVDRDDLGYSRKDFLNRLRTYIRRIKRDQGAAGGWGYYDFRVGAQHPAGFQSTSFLTASILLALKDMMELGLDVPKHLISGGVQTLKRLRTPERTFIYGNYAQYWPRARFNKPKGTLGRNQNCNLALYRFNTDVTIADMKLGLDRLFTYHHFINIARGRPMPHETWYANAGYYFFYGHFYAAQVIEQLPPEDQGGHWMQLSNVMLNTQQKDGSWWDFPLYGYYKQYGTGFALHTLIQCHKANMKRPS